MFTKLTFIYRSRLGSTVPRLQLKSFTKPKVELQKVRWFKQKEKTNNKVALTTDKQFTLLPKAPSVLYHTFSDVWFIQTL